MENRMGKEKNYFRTIFFIFAFSFILSGCSDRTKLQEEIVMDGGQETAGDGGTKKDEEIKMTEDEKIGNEDEAKIHADFPEPDAEKLTENTTSNPETEKLTENITPEPETEKLTENITPEPEIIEVDWSEYFGRLNGAAVVYDALGGQYMIYNSELAKTRRSPCSTFKIVSSLIALENKIIDKENSGRTWSGEIFWNENWNRDIDFGEAFRTSCVWYFRGIIDEIGKEKMQEELNRLAYGNCDISDWEGRLNNNNSNPALTGFWVESSLLISPKEQTEIMERIFGDATVYPQEIRERLMQVMLLQEQNETGISIYGKTGMGKSHGVVVDAWYTGFADCAGRRIYFCVYLGETDNQNVSSTRAREIAVEIISGL